MYTDLGRSGDTFAVVGDRDIWFDMNIDMGGRIAGKQYMPGLIIEDPPPPK